jgi:hypothetical protein
MEAPTLNETKKSYRVVVESLATEGRVFKRGDKLTAEDAPGEIESLLHAGVIKPLEIERTDAGLS